MAIAIKDLSVLPLAVRDVLVAMAEAMQGDMVL